MKTNIVGWMYLILSPIFILVFLALTALPLADGLLRNGGMMPAETFGAVLLGFLALIFAVVGLILGSGLRAHKKWAWFLGIVLIPLVLIGNIVSLVNHVEILAGVAILVNIFSIYALISERKIFQ